MLIRPILPRTSVLVFSLLIGAACSSSTPENVNDAAMATDAPSGLEAAAPKPSVAVACSGEYLTCGVGCNCPCGGAMKTACYFPSDGDTIASLATWNQPKEGNTCDPASCTEGTRYVCCPDLPAEPMAAATYTAEWITFQAMTYLQVTKRGSDCATLRFFQPGENYSRIRAPINMGVSVDSVGSCGDTGAETVNTTGVGTFTRTLTGTTCVREQVSLHATVFALDATGVAKAVRMDADDLVASMPAPGGACP